MGVLARKDYPGGRAFEVAIGDLLDERTDGIVNAANGHLAHGGGVAAAIARAAGTELEAEGDRLVRERGPVPAGSAVLTTAGRLPFKGVIHAVGPRQGEGGEEDTLVAALRSAFRIADAEGWTSVSFPAISSGIFGVPPEVCARAYLRAVDERLGAAGGSLRSLRLVLFDGPVAKAIARLLSGAAR